MTLIPPGFLALSLTGGAGDAAPPEQVAETVLGVLREIDLALGPVIGTRGVSALVDRSLHRTAGAHPWLVDANDGLDTAPDFQRLANSLAGRSGGEIASAGAELLQTLHALLVSLVGEVLTERLIGGVWSELLGGLPPLDTTP